MRATSIVTSDTRIVPARPENQIETVKVLEDGSMDLTFKDGRKGSLTADDIDLQAFAVWTMLNPECRK